MNEAMSPEHSFGSYVTSENGKKVVKDLTFGNHTPEGVVLTTLDSAVNWMRKNSIWPLTFGLEMSLRTRTPMLTTGGSAARNCCSCVKSCFRCPASNALS